MRFSHNPFQVFKLLLDFQDLKRFNFEGKRFKRFASLLTCLGVWLNIVVVHGHFRLKEK